MIRKDGTILPVAVSATALRDEAGNFLRSHSILIDISDRKKIQVEYQVAQAALQESEEYFRVLFNLPVERSCAEVSIAENLQDTQRLHHLSTRLTTENDIQVLYDEILITAIAMMYSDMGSLQLLDRSQNELHLQSIQGFHPDAVTFWQNVKLGAGCICSQALEQGERVIVSDIETCDLMAETEELNYYRLCGESERYSHHR